MSALLSCPKFSRCNASICPLDGEWDRRKMLDNEPLCFYLLEHAKKGSKARFEERGLRQLYEVIDRVLPEQSSKWGKLRRTYERAKTSGSRLGKLPIWIRNANLMETES
jgi:hypothetical protein